MGLVGPHTPDTAVQRLLPTIRHDVSFESDRLRDMDLTGHHRMDEGATIDRNAQALAGFLDIPADLARELAATDQLFVD
jgi:hypothetical protein